MDFTRTLAKLGKVEDGEDAATKFFELANSKVGASFEEPRD